MFGISKLFSISKALSELLIVPKLINEAVVWYVFILAILELEWTFGVDTPGVSNS